MVEMIADRRFDEARRVGAGEAVLGLALELRVADEDRQHDFRARDDVVRLDILGLLLPRQLAEGADAPRQRRADALFMGAAVRRRNGVAIIRGTALAPKRPGDRPFDRALPVRKILLALYNFEIGRAPCRESAV